MKKDKKSKWWKYLLGLGALTIVGGVIAGGVVSCSNGSTSSSNTTTASSNSASGSNTSSNATSSAKNSTSTNKSHNDASSISSSTKSSSTHTSSKTTSNYEWSNANEYQLSHDISPFTNDDIIINAGGISYEVNPTSFNDTITMDLKLTEAGKEALLSANATTRNNNLKNSIDLFQIEQSNKNPLSVSLPSDNGTSPNQTISNSSLNFSFNLMPATNSSNTQIGEGLLVNNSTTCYCPLTIPLSDVIDGNYTSHESLTINYGNKSTFTLNLNVNMAPYFWSGNHINSKTYNPTFLPPLYEQIIPNWNPILITKNYNSTTKQLLFSQVMPKVNVDGDMFYRYAGLLTPLILFNQTVADKSVDILWSQETQTFQFYGYLNGTSWTTAKTMTYDVTAFVNDGIEWTPLFINLNIPNPLYGKVIKN